MARSKFVSGLPVDGRSISWVWVFAIVGAFSLSTADLVAQSPGLLDNGAIVHWNVLGPFGTLNCNLPGDDPVDPPAAFDYISDGTIKGDEWEPNAGDTIDPDFNGPRAAVRWMCNWAVFGDPSLDCAEALPTVAFMNSPEPRGYIDINAFWSGQALNLGGNGSAGGAENVMGYAWTYVENITGEDIPITIGHNSDDSWRILVNREEIGKGQACRPPDPDGIQEMVGPAILVPGRNVIMTETWEGCCNWGFVVKLFHEGSTTPLTLDEIEIKTAPPVFITRDIPANPAAGSTVGITIDILNDGPPVANAEIRERIPNGFVAANQSAPGTIDTDANGRQTISWKYVGDLPSTTLTYDITIPNPFANGVAYRGSVAIVDGKGNQIFGDISFTGGTSPNVQEALFVTLKQPATWTGNNPGDANLRRDLLTDGDADNELTIAPAAGDSISPDFNGASASPGPGNTSATALVWTRITTGNGWFELNSCDQCMSYVAFYVELDKPMRIGIGSASDDSEHILVDGVERWIHSIARGAGTASPQDHSPEFDLAAGKHLVLQKVYEGGGGFNSSILFEDEDGNPTLLKTTLDPTGYPVGTAFVSRAIGKTLNVGESGKVTLKLRVKAPTNDASIEENVPAGFAISNVSPGGVVNGQKITWSINGPLSNQDLSYTIAVPASSIDVAFSGTATLGGKAAAILGDNSFTRGIMNTAGFLKHWLVFGPLDTLGIWPGDLVNPNLNVDGPSATPEGGDLRSKDYITNGTVGEKNIRPFDGMVHVPSFGGDGVSGAYSKAMDLFPPERVCAPAVPTWEQFIVGNGTLDNDTYFGGAVDSHATVAVTYVTNTTVADIDANVAVNSDDAFIAFLDGTEIVAYEPGPCTATACGRGFGGENTVMEVMPVKITPGEHYLLTRVHDGGGGSGHRLRFQDATGNPILPPALTLSAKSVKDAPAGFVTRRLSAEGYFPPAQITVTLKVEVSGTHNLAIDELLPAGFSAEGITDGGVLGGGKITWTLNGVSAAKDLSYKLVPTDVCAGDGSFCGSTYKVDGGADAHALRGHDSFRRDALRTTDSLGDWTVQDFGVRGNAAARQGPSAVDIQGKGAGVRAAKDEARFVYVPASGDFQLTTRIDCMGDPGGAGQGGLMVRDTTDAFSATVFFALSSTVPAAGGVGTLKATFRRETNAKRNTGPVTVSNKDVDSLPIFLRLKRTGTVISMQRSSDGAAFEEVAIRNIGIGTTEVNLKADTLIGLTVTSGGGGTTRADFRDVTGVPPVPNFIGVPPDAPTTLSAAAGNAQVSLAWVGPAGGAAPTGFNIYRGTAAGGPYSKIAEVGLSPTTHVDTTVTNGTNYCYVVKSRRGSVESAGSTNEACATPTGVVEKKFRRGNANSDEQLDLTDPVTVLNYQFLGGPVPSCLDAADADDSGTLDLTDAVYSLNYQFLAGPKPPAPGPDVCGRDPTEEVPDLGCVVSCP